MEQPEIAAPRRYLFIGGSHAATEGNVMADRGHEVIVCAVNRWRPNKTAVEEMAARAEEALRELSPNDVVVLHLFDNVAYMARSEEGGDLPIRPRETWSWLGRTGSSCSSRTHCYCCGCLRAGK